VSIVYQNESSKTTGEFAPLLMRSNNYFYIWWFMQAELPTNPELSAHTDEITSVKSGPMLILELLFSLVPLDHKLFEEKQ
jgi:hypothetical protein